MPAVPGHLLSDVPEVSSFSFLPQTDDTAVGRPQIEEGAAVHMFPRRSRRPPPAWVTTKQLAIAADHTCCKFGCGGARARERQPATGEASRRKWGWMAFLLQAIWTPGIDGVAGLAFVPVIMSHYQEVLAYTLLGACNNGGSARFPFTLMYSLIPNLYACRSLEQAIVVTISTLALLLHAPALVYRALE